MKILIVEDEVMVARAIQRMLTSILQGQKAEIVHAPELGEAMEFLSASAFDVVLLDLNLNGRDGMDLLAQLVASPFQTIIVSANTDQAVRAFDFGVVDFVAKPFTQERLARALNRVSLTELSEHSGQGAAEFLGIRRGSATKMVAVESVCHIRAADNYSEVFTVPGDTFLHEKNLGRLLRILPNNFQRVHRSYIVNLKLVNGLNSFEGSRYEIQLQTGTTLPAGRHYIAGLRARLG